MKLAFSCAARLLVVATLSAAFLLSAATTTEACPQNLTEQLAKQDSAALAARAIAEGDPSRGAMVYYNPVMTCVTCHEPRQGDLVSQGQPTLGPPLAEFNRKATTEHLIQSLIHPSAEIAEGYATETILTDDGRQVTGLISKSNDGQTITVTDPLQIKQPIQISVDSIDDRKVNKVSAMPEGLLGALPNEQSFLDLVAYLRAVKDGGESTKQKLRPPESFFAVAPLPEYEMTLDHARLLGQLNDETLAKGEATYVRFCARCHGDNQQEGSMPAAMKFDTGKFKFGNDPYSMYKTMTHGNGLMVAQRWMVPKQKYEVIHYIRERILREKNKAQYFEVSDDYATRLPAGKDLGPDPVVSQPWSDMDYGNFLFNTIEVGQDRNNIAYKGVSVRLNGGPGGVSQGRHWMMYEHDTMRVAAAWSGSGFIDYNGIHFNDRHAVHPRIVGSLAISNDHLPGWANPQTGSFEDDPRVVGRDGKKYGPLPESWLKYRGLYRFDDKVILNYSVGETDVLELPTLQFVGQQPVFQRTLNLAARSKPLRVRIANVDNLDRDSTKNANGIVYFGDLSQTPESSANGPDESNLSLDGSRYLLSKQVFDWRKAITVVARIKTKNDGTIVCQTKGQTEWVAGGTSLFVRDGRLVFDIGWVGAVASENSIDDDQWHDVALVWSPDEELVRLYIDGQLDCEDELSTGKEYAEPVLRVGYTADNFPESSAFDGEIANLRIWQTALNAADISSLRENTNQASRLIKNAVGDWALTNSNDDGVKLADRSSSKNDLQWFATERVEQTMVPQAQPLWCHVKGIETANWSVEQSSVCLDIPAGIAPLSITISVGRLATKDAREQGSKKAVESFIAKQAESPPANIRSMTLGSAPRYPDVLTSKIQTRPSTKGGAFEVDWLVEPESNPWACRMRFTGIDFADNDTAFVCAWDGSVWRVEGFSNGNTLTWRRIAHGMYQPLGIRFVGEQVFVTCRDQIVALEDLDNDGYTDFYRAFNSDHQVTEHFHEFAMGLQSDEEGNLYYAKSARHAKKAIVPHHGTLLKVSADGRDTEIVANGFRAANGVCLNPDGSFYVTDQEGHWNPKNRINWVQASGFYGNMMGYHDVTDESDEAMIEPMCWITNAFDRSPGELMWVPENTWGPLAGSLLNLSYGMGQVFVVPHQKISGGRDVAKPDRLQGGMCRLPLPLFPTGVMRGRFHSDGHLYCCGMYAWAGNQQRPGGLYRIRKSDQPAWLPIGLQASKETIQIELSDVLPAGTKLSSEDFAVKVWDIQRTATYGSPHLNERELKIEDVLVKENRRTVELTIAGLEPVRCMEIKCFLTASDGSKFTRVIHNTIHALPDSAKK